MTILNHHIANALATQQIAERRRQAAANRLARTDQPSRRHRLNRAAYQCDSAEGGTNIEPRLPANAYGTAPTSTQPAR